MICRVCPRCRKRMYSASAEERIWKCIYCGAPVSGKYQVCLLKQCHRRPGKHNKKLVAREIQNS